MLGSADRAMLYGALARRRVCDGLFERVDECPAIDFPIAFVRRSLSVPTGRGFRSTSPRDPSRAAAVPAEGLQMICEFRLADAQHLWEVRNVSVETVGLV